MNKANRPTTRDRAVALAIQFRGQGTYKLGAGMGDHPHAESPLERGACDCSNFVNWLLGNVLSGAVYANTDGVCRDAYGVRSDGAKESPRQQTFTPVPPGEVPLPGDLVVVPGVFDTVGGKPFRTRPGHIGMIVQVLPGFRRDMDFEETGHRFLRVVHCAGNRGVPPAIRETDAAPWRARGYLVRYKGFTA